MIRRRDVLVRGSAGALGFAAAAKFGGVARAAGAPVTIAYPADVPSWDPSSAGAAIAASIYKCVFDMALNVAPDLGFGPSVVAKHEWIGKDGRTLELTLREGVTFHNGDPLTSEDIKFTFFDRPKADNKLMIAGVWGRTVAAIETPSPSKAIFKFNFPFVTAPQLLADIPAYVLPRRYFEKVGRDGFIAKPIGAGPYRLVDYTRDSRIVLEAYDKYWQGPAKIDRLVWQIVKDTSARIAAVQSGQVDCATNLPVREVVRLASHPGLSGLLHPITNVFLIHMVNKGIFKDKNLRLAMHHAIDKPALSKAFFDGKAAPLSMWAGEGMPGYDPNFKFGYDPALAKSLLAQSGYSDKKPAKIPFLTFNGVYPNDYDVARAIVAMWKRVGIEADLSVIEMANYSELSRNDKLEAPVLYSWANSTGDPEVYSGYILDPKKRFSVWKSEDVSAKLDPLLSEPDYDKRIKGYREFDAWAVAQGYAFPMFQGVAAVVHAKRIGYKPFRNGWILPYHWTVA
jgi:peptide/nickel transport system substrate-binding protein